MTAKKAQLNPLLKLVLDLGPLLLFFLANSRPALFLPLVSPILRGDSVLDEPAGIFVATAVFMVAVVVALVDVSEQPSVAVAVSEYYQGLELPPGDRVRTGCAQVHFWETCGKTLAPKKP